MRLRLPSAAGICLLVLAACAPGSPGRPDVPLRPEYRLVPPLAPAESAATAREVAEIERLPGEAFAAHTFRADNGVELRYRLLSPLDPRPGRRYPLVVVFHGSGEMGTDNRKHLDRFPKAWARERIRREFPAWVLAPQMPERSANYTGPPGTPGRSSVPAPPMFAALALIDSLRALPAVDPERIYAVGFSMGGSTVWNAVAHRPELFAAAVPIAGVPNRDRVRQAAATPLWIVHGNADEANPIGPDREVYLERLRNLPGARVSFWEFDGMHHRVPPRLLAGDRLARWLFSHRKR